MRSRFIAAARREFLAQVLYYSKEESGLGARFTAAVEEATARALAFLMPDRLSSKIRDAFSSGIFRSQLSIDRTKRALKLSR